MFPWKRYFCLIFNQEIRFEFLNSLCKLSCNSLNQALILINDYLHNIPFLFGIQTSI